MRIWRSISAPLRRRPDAVIIGTQRGGTTSLFNWLADHPEAHPVSFTRHQEVHFFDDRYDRGLLWYRSLFPITRAGFAYEATPSLLAEHDAPARFASALPDALAVVLLRNPVDRAISQYHHTTKQGTEARSFDEAFWTDNTGMGRQFTYRERGHYEEQLDRWVAAIGRDRLVIAVSEELFADPRTVVGAIVDALGYAPHDFRADHHNRQEYPPIDAEARDRMLDYYRERNTGLESLIGRPVPWW